MSNQFIAAMESEPVIVLVHKDNPSISFMGSLGILEEEILLEYIERFAKIGGSYYGVKQ